MTTFWGLTFDPLIPAFWIGVLVALGLGQLLVSFVRLKKPGALRLGLYAFFALTLANPILHKDLREPLADVVVLAVDKSQSQDFGNRSENTQRMVQDLTEDLSLRANLEVRTIDVTDQQANALSRETEGGTHLVSAINAALADIPEKRLAAIIAITDGQATDAATTELSSAAAAPFHTLLTGSRQDKDRRLVLSEAPKFGIVGKETTATIRIDDIGHTSEVPPAFNMARVSVRLNGDTIGTTLLTVGEEHPIVFRLERRGESIVEIDVAPLDGELTDLNNKAAFSVNGIRDRLRVLLVSGEPHTGERTWRNLLNADPSVDLVHFTILRPPEKQDGTPANELSLIAFPTRELFAQKLGEFDLVIFDRFRRRGLLPVAYLANVARYVENGGALMTAAGPSFATPLSLYMTPLADVLPAAPDGRVLEEGYRPQITELGFRHPVTAKLPGANASTPQGQKEATWGRWFRAISANNLRGETLMVGPDNTPLLVVDRYGRGRVAQLLTDQGWLWSRGFEGGGPQAELLRRTAHWLMKEPELEEERLSAVTSGGEVKVTRHTLSETALPATIFYPSGRSKSLPFEKTQDGEWQATFTSDELGLHRIEDEALATLVAIGPLNPREFENVVTTEDKLKPLSNASDGALLWHEDVGTPTLYDAKPGRRMHTTSRLGLKRNNQFNVLDVKERPLIPPLAALILLGSILVLTWRREAN
ncbi:MAG: hypothetical protein EP340_08195 [Alphaproteobacteria bacterium]|nr:MAG: hypothetical protein EP340_08195 [Alphaproteobacteria bacterium]